MNIAGDVLVVGHQLYARANTTSPATPAADTKPASYKIIGLVLAIGSGLFIGVSFVLKKHGLLKANIKYNEEAGEGYGYLKNVWWWTGMTLMILGEICNFAAYLFADAILVTPLGALSVVITAILSGIFLKERLSFVGKIGCFLCIIGSVVIAANAPEQGAVSNIQDMQKLVISPGFLSYAGVIIIGCAIVAFFVAPKYGKKSMMVYITICSLIGGLSVVSIQGLGAAITAQARGQQQFNKWFTYVLLVFIIGTLVTEVIFLNKALNLFNAALVTPTYYVYFTTATIVSSSVLFRGFKGTPIQILTVVLGFLEICAGVVLLQLSKSAKDVPDAAVFKGDLDQVRTVAEQEEPEYEPRADTIRGGGAILRSFSKIRQSRQWEEAKRIKQEHDSMQPIGENEHVEFDGIRRRRTIIGDARNSGRPGTATTISGSVIRRKSIHPPLGMSKFPDEHEEEADDTSMHPGFFSHFVRRNRSSKTLPPTPEPESHPLSPVKSGDSTWDAGLAHPRPQFAGHDLPPGFLSHIDSDTTYKSPAQSHIQWASATSLERPGSRPSMLTPPPPHPPPPPHRVPTPGSAKRQFSFTNVFHRRTASDSNDDFRPTSRGGLSFVTRNASKTGKSDVTEEERMGLVKGDSSTHLSGGRSDSPPSYSDPEEDWRSAGASSSPLGAGAAEMRAVGGGLMDVEQTRLPRYNTTEQVPTTIRPVDARRQSSGQNPGATSRPRAASRDDKGPGGAAFI